MNDAIIEVSDINYSYGSHPILEDINFVIKKQDYVGIIGPNGGGKTTLLKLLLGLLPLQSGSIKIFGKHLSSLRTRHKIGYVPQKISQANISFPATVEEVVYSGLTPKLSLLQPLQHSDRAALESAMKAADIEHLRSKLLDELSGGERQRVYVARALAAESELLILDEPFVGIDVVSQENFYAFLRRLNESHGLTILFVSHDIDVISTEVKQMLCLNHRLVCQGKPKDIIEGDMIEKLYGKTVTHIHHHRH